MTAEQSTIIVALIGTLTTLTAWRLNRHKDAAAADSSIAEGANFAVETMLQVMGELREQVERLTAEAANLKQENRELRFQIGILQAEIRKLRGEAV